MQPPRKHRTGQALTEYIVPTAIIAIGVVVTVTLFGDVVLGVFSQIAAAMKKDPDAPPDNKSVEEALSFMELDAGTRRNMRNFDWKEPGADGGGGIPGGGSGGSGGLPGGSTDPDQPPARPDSLAYGGNHHLGNNGTVDSSALNEGQD